MSDNLYQIMRNREALASHRAWSEETGARGRPIIMVGVVSVIIGISLFFLDLHRHSDFARGAGAALLSVGSGLLMTGLVLVARYRKFHPWTPS